MNNALHPKDDADTLYTSRKERLTSVENCVDASEQELEEHIKKSKERLITAASYSNNNIKTEKYRKQKEEEKQFHGYFKQQIGVMAHGNIWE